MTSFFVSSIRRALMKSAAIVLSGSFNPVHKEHLHIISRARDFLLARGFDSVEGYLYASTDEYLVHKLGIWGMKQSERFRMCEIAIQDIPWMHTFRNGTASSRQTAKNLEDELRNRCSTSGDPIPVVYEVGGADYCLRCNIFNSNRPFICVERPSEKIPRSYANKQLMIVPVEEEAQDVSSTAMREYLQQWKEGKIRVEGLRCPEGMDERVFVYLIQNFRNLFLLRGYDD